MPRSPSLRIRTALAIGGLDPSGGAGVVADLRAFRVAGVWGAAVVAAQTVQSTRGVKRVAPTEPALVRQQVDEVVADLDVRAIKTGALGSLANLRTVTRLAETRSRIVLVVDPVLGPSRGAGALNLNSRAASQAQRRLLRQANLMTPNVPEAEALLGGTIATPAQARDAAMALLELGPAAVLLKGGHLAEPPRQIVDWLATYRGVERIAHQRLALGDVHGTGCTLAALIAGQLARGPRSRKGRRRGSSPGGELSAIVRWATRTLGLGLRSAARVGKGMAVLGAPSPRKGTLR